MSQTIDAEPVSTTAVVRHSGEHQEPRVVTPAQAKTDAIASLTMTAYARASQLALTPEEIAKLAEDFPDDAFKPGAAGKENLIYIEHAFLRDRLNSVFGPGQWALIPRNRWAEDFTLPARHNKPETHGSRIYVEAMLMIRGCFVSESVGAMEYYPSNNSQNYGDAVEGAKTAALRRCCKELGVGLQAWKKDWCNSWWDRQRQGRNSNTRGMTGGSQNFGASGAATRGGESVSSGDTVKGCKDPRGTGSPCPTETRAANPTARTVPPSGKSATTKHRDRMLEVLIPIHGQDGLLNYARSKSFILPSESGEGLGDIPLRFVPVDEHQLNLMKADIEMFYEGAGNDRPPFVNPEPVEVKTEGHRGLGVGGMAPEVPRDPAVGAWRDVPVLFGKNKDKTLGQLEKNSLAWYCREFKVAETFEGRDGKPVRKKPEAMAKDIEFRRALDAAMAEMGITNDGGDR